MSKADEMFEQLGYKKKYGIFDEKIVKIGYTQNDNDEVDDCNIIFYTMKELITLRICCDMEGIKAINLKVKELRVVR